MDAKRLGEAIREAHEADLADALMGLSPRDFGEVLSLIHWRDDKYLSKVLGNMEDGARDALIPPLDLGVELARITKEHLADLLEGISYDMLSNDELTNVLVVVLESAGKKEGILSQIIENDVDDQTLYELIRGLFARWSSMGQSEVDVIARIVLRDGQIVVEPVLSQPEKKKK